MSFNVFLQLLNTGANLSAVGAGVRFLGMVGSNVLAKVTHVFPAIRTKLVSEVGVGGTSDEKQKVTLLEVKYCLAIDKII